ncbi:hypothetical protein KBTX_00168 [wastewater metagenome]|uniref:FAD/NAD(P)-binding domain-containing protein n=2 Tax=unclassified sequences TaxID=12908 RepID=A0A5B8R7A9_9ZZZZ|nr:FAD/NAD(P)-binding oxidoreductase [Arhodomonas sp. KWT]QEA03868.1 hypothetical protein KBTEX_00168 [uncultured organism]
MTQSHDVLIVGGGTAGITVAAQLRRRRSDIDVAVIEPSDTHYYQPGFTLAGAGVARLPELSRPTARVMPDGVTWHRAAVTAVDPAQSRVGLDDGRELGYSHLVLAPGLTVDWDAIPGVAEALGRDGVCSNYSPGTVGYTWECLRNHRGGRLVFTQPPMPIKCPGAPQKIAYLAADHLRRQGHRDEAQIDFYTAGKALFSVPEFVPPLERVAERHGIDVHYGRRLTAVDGARREATFTGEDGDETVGYDVLHVTPPQRAPAFVREGPLADEAGWIAVDKATLRHPDYPAVFALGDACNTPNSKTAAAVRRQAPVVVDGLLAELDGRTSEAAYDGYGACPLTTAYGRVLLAEFRYGGELAPTFPGKPTEERRSMWHFKKDFLPRFYWHHLLRGGTL